MHILDKRFPLMKKMIFKNLDHHSLRRSKKANRDIAIVLWNLIHSIISLLNLWSNWDISKNWVMCLSLQLNSLLEIFSSRPRAEQGWRERLSIDAGLNKVLTGLTKNSREYLSTGNDFWYQRNKNALPKFKRFYAQ